MADFDWYPVPARDEDPLMAAYCWAGEAATPESRLEEPGGKGAARVGCMEDPVDGNAVSRGGGDRNAEGAG